MNHWIKGASSYAADIDGLFWLVTALIGFWFIVAGALSGAVAGGFVDEPQ